MALLRDKPATLAAAKKLIDNLAKYTSVGMFMDHSGTIGAIVNTPDDTEGVDIKLTTSLDSQWLQVTRFMRDPYKENPTRVRITRPTAAKIKQILIDKYAPDYHPNKTR